MLCGTSGAVARRTAQRVCRASVQKKQSNTCGKTTLVRQHHTNHNTQLRAWYCSSSSLSSLSSRSWCRHPVHSLLLHRGFATEAAKVPSLGDSITEGTVVKWQKNVGDHVEQDEVLLIIETDKVSVDIRAPKGGKVKVQLVKEGDTVKVGDTLAEIDTEDKGGAAAKKEEKPAAAKPSISTTDKKEAAPSQSKGSVKDAQPEHKVVEGSQEKEEKPLPSPKAQSGAAPHTGSTVQPGSKQPDTKATPPPSTKPSVSPSSPPTPGSRSVRRVPMSRMRQTIAARLKAAQNTAAMLTTFNEVDMTNIIELRNKFKDEFQEKTGVKLGFMSAFVKASTAALLKWPDVNASIEGTDIVYHDYVDISVAVSTPSGLVVPVVRNCETLNFAQIEAAIAALGNKARKGQIALEDMVGGTFTISNGGVYGSMFGTPIINPPQSAILGMHATFKRPVAINDTVQIRPMMYIALTYDHRLIDGSTAVQFLKEIKFNVEDPSRLLLSI